ncbi:Vasohibin-2 [Monoraphidium neglectum]|uniref:Vasohibin-2 n=1 Tax=Monoraphidium neglectum TaxID=145388 RepID=A0A0D2LC82_9CHLO|nr:Vasohibin-2 [Monoraphidium neglectum]KIZ04359.1 Vasohibin-2 [Monoraphidium neglectum]|eukprot:XP_013903378.1 Vasohibin-2 [Monoraphidium neglectum]
MIETAPATPRDRQGAAAAAKLKALRDARDILREPLPIKCVEATFVALLVTCGWRDLDRVAVGFKSRAADGQCYRHIVLAVRDTSSGLWGALGLSRRRELMDKPLRHSSLSALVGDFVAAYALWGHEVLKVRMFFVGTAPLAAEGHVNLSPKGHREQTFAILSDNQVAYLDMTGSGIETLAHIKENGRITFMFCSFEGSPCIMRLYGRAVAHELGTPEFEDIVARAFPAAAPVDGDAGPGDAPAAPAGVIGPHPGFAAGARSVIVADIYEVASACGYAVPLMEFKEERDSLVTWSAKKGQEAIEEYRRGHATSLDGLRGLNIAPGPAVGAT